MTHRKQQKNGHNTIAAYRLNVDCFIANFGHRTK